MPFRQKDGFKSRPVVVLSGHHHNQARRDVVVAGTSKTKLMLAIAYSSAIAPDDVYPNLKPKRRTGYA
jgi:mRNA-degrading endonuclease toxin of MazEF toxin-antitoxin module